MEKQIWFKRVFGVINDLLAGQVLQYYSIEVFYYSLIKSFSLFVSRRVLWNYRRLFLLYWTQQIIIITYSITHSVALWRYFSNLKTYIK